MEGETSPRGPDGRKFDAAAGELPFYSVNGTAAGNSAIADALDCLPLGVILVDARGAVVHVNESAKAIVQSGRGLRLSKGCLAGEVAEDCAALKALIARSARPDLRHGCGGAMAISRPGQERPLSLIVTPLRRRPGGPCPGSPVAVVFVSDPEDNRQSPEDHLVQLFGLTRTEASLTLVLLEGQGLEWAAEQAGMSVNTARTHLKRIFGKTGTHRQAELVRLILRSPAMLRQL